MILNQAENEIGIGVISHAHGHANVYCEVMQSFADVRLVANWDDNEPRGRQAALDYGMDFRSRLSDLLHDQAIDAVIVASETNRHAELIDQAAAAGKHVLCQKPLATTLEDCDRIIDAVRRSDIKFSVAYQMRHDPVNQKMKQLLDAGAVGRVAVVRRRHAINVLLNEAFVTGPTRWHFDPIANIGMFFDDASHAADWFYWMLGQPRSVVAEIDSVVTEVAPDDNGVAVYRFGQGEIGILLNSSTTVAAVSTTEIYGDEGTIVHDYGDGPATAAGRPSDASPLRLLRRGDSAWTTFDLPIPRSQRDRIAAVPRPFVDYVHGVAEQPVSAEEGRRSVEMVLGAYESARTGCRVSLPL